MHVTSKSRPGTGVKIDRGSYLHWIHPDYGTLGKRNINVTFENDMFLMGLLLFQQLQVRMWVKNHVLKLNSSAVGKWSLI